jgi:hypothetical protein
MSRAVNVLALVRDGQRYVFLYDDQSTEQVQAQMAAFAEDHELDFTWYDAAVLSQRVRELHASSEDTAESRQTRRPATTGEFPTWF